MPNAVPRRQFIREAILKAVGISTVVSTVESATAGLVGIGSPQSGVEVQDEGSVLGRAKRLDFTGGGVTASLSDDKATVNVPAGGGTENATYNLFIGDTATITLTATGGGTFQSGKIYEGSRAANSAGSTLFRRTYFFEKNRGQITVKGLRVDYRNVPSGTGESLELCLWNEVRKRDRTGGATIIFSELGTFCDVNTAFLTRTIDFADVIVVKDDSLEWECGMNVTSDGAGTAGSTSRWHIRDPLLDVSVP